MFFEKNHLKLIYENNKQEFKEDFPKLYIKKLPKNNQLCFIIAGYDNYEDKVSCELGCSGYNENVCLTKDSCYIKENKCISCPSDEIIKEQGCKIYGVNKESCNMDPCDVKNKAVFPEGKKECGIILIEYQYTEFGEICG